MRAWYSLRFEKSFKQFPLKAQDKFEKKLLYLLDDIRHPSLNAKKYNESRGIWQARVDKNIRFYFTIKKDTYILLDITYHPK